MSRPCAPSQLGAARWRDGEAAAISLGSAQAVYVPSQRTLEISSECGDLRVALLVNAHMDIASLNARTAMKLCAWAVIHCCCSSAELAELAAKLGRESEAWDR